MHGTIRIRWPAAALLGALGLAGCAAPHPPGAATPGLADAALQAGYPSMALSVADRILARDPNNVPALVARGDALLNSGRADDAAQSYRKALAVKPDDAGANLGLGRVLTRRDPHAAERHFRTALKSRPDDPVLLADLGVALDLQQRHVEAQAAYRRSLQLAPTSAATKANLGLSLALSGDRAGAQRVLEPLAADPQAPQVAHDNLAVARMQPLASAAPAGPAAPAPMPAAPTPVAPAPAAPAAPVSAAPAAPAPAAAAASAPSPAAAAPQPVAVAVAPSPIPAPSPAAATPQPVAAQPGEPDAGQGIGPGDAFVQLAAADSREHAVADWERERRRGGGLLADKAPQIVPATVNGRAYWRLRIAAPDAAAARQLCVSLRQKGVQCWVPASKL